MILVILTLDADVTVASRNGILLCRHTWVMKIQSLPTITNHSIL
jgi:hypothetical protein